MGMTDIVFRPEENETIGAVGNAIKSLVINPDEVKSVSLLNEKGNLDLTFVYNEILNVIECESFIYDSLAYPDVFMHHTGLDYTGIKIVEEHLYPPEFHMKWHVFLVE